VRPSDPADRAGSPEPAPSCGGTRPHEPAVPADPRRPPQPERVGRGRGADEDPPTVPTGLPAVIPLDQPAPGSGAAGTAAPGRSTAPAPAVSGSVSGSAPVAVSEGTAVVRRRSRRRSAPAAAGAGPGPVGHGHAHGHAHAPPAGRRVRLLIAALLVPCAVATLVGLVLLWPTGGPQPTTETARQQAIAAEVTAAQATDCTQGSGDGGCVALVVRMEDGPLPGRDLVQIVPLEPGTPEFAVGDDVVLAFSGADATDPGSYQIIDFQRGGSLLWLAAAFAAAVLLLGRWRGLAALGALGLSFAVLLLFVLPAILAGRDPLAVAVVGSCVIMFAVLYLTHGPSARTSTAVLGTLVSLALIGVLGAVFSAGAQLTGLDDQTSTLIATLGTGVDARGLLLAGVVIGALGVLDDVTVTQSSAVWELRRANPDLGAAALFASAMRIGRDHVAAAVNTLVLAYAGAALPLLLLFTVSGQGIGTVLSSQDIATEVVRTLVGSIGLVASVPITTALAAAVASRESRAGLAR
jgi:uncharacterized membrane protein